IPALWNASATSNADRKAIIRCLIDKVVVYIENDTEVGEAVIHWKGGFESRREVIRPVHQYEQLRDIDRLMQRIAELRAEGRTAGNIANQLNEEGFRPINPKQIFNSAIVGDLLRKANLCGELQDDTLLGQDEWWIRDLAKELGVKWQTFREWGIKGWIHSRQTKIQKLRIIWADEGEIQRIRRLLSAKPRGTHGYPRELLIPNERPDTSR
ncbi:MAG: recombinase family protein, partial [Candidatus Marinimicrobia bacterium]|nr:recombinase family protein [Candidatus Neomarinimicrobiota bacterium]